MANMQDFRNVAIPRKAKELVAAEARRMREEGLCASEKMVVANCIYQVLDKNALGGKQEGV
jgi:hypothetical protein